MNIGKGEQFTPEFLKISPNNRMPAIVDPTARREALPLESGAILIYLGEKTGQFLPREPRARYEVLQWLMFQMGGIGPMFGQAGHFRRYAPEKIPYAIDRYTNESQRLLRVLDGRLADRPFVAGDSSIADMAIFPWVHAVDEALGGFDATPNVARWVATLRARPAVERGLAVMNDTRRPTEMSEEARSVLFGARQFAGR